MPVVPLLRTDSPSSFLRLTALSLSSLCCDPLSTAFLVLRISCPSIVGAYYGSYNGGLLEDGTDSLGIEPSRGLSVWAGANLSGLRGLEGLKEVEVEVVSNCVVADEVTVAVQDLSELDLLLADREFVAERVLSNTSVVFKGCSVDIHLAAGWEVTMNVLSWTATAASGSKVSSEDGGAIADAAIIKEGCEFHIVTLDAASSRESGAPEVPHRLRLELNEEDVFDVLGHNDNDGAPRQGEPLTREFAKCERLDVLKCNVADFDRIMGASSAHYRKSAWGGAPFPGAEEAAVAAVWKFQDSRNPRRNVVYCNVVKDDRVCEGAAVVSKNTR